MLRVMTCLALGTLLLAGCSSYRPKLFQGPNSLSRAPRLSDVDRARLLQDQGEHTAATIEFRKALECAADDWERDEARIGAAKSLIAMHRYAPAMTILGPLPVVAESDFDCRKLAIAGEILLRQHRAEEAETCLELALDGCALEAFLPPPSASGDGPYVPPRTPPVAAADFQAPAVEYLDDHALEVVPPGGAEMLPIPAPAPEARLAPAVSDPSVQPAPFLPAQAALPPAWLPGCCANLGLAYLKNDKPEKAAVLYGFAAHLSRQRGKHLDAERAQRTHDELEAVLRQYAPYKPHPVSQRFPSGRE
jgi:tetratricopeptide (TPR) repeat protein